MAARGVSSEQRRVSSNGSPRRRRVGHGHHDRHRSHRLEATGRDSPCKPRLHIERTEKLLQIDELSLDLDDQ
jgi:hypothetical protein